jgi:FkbM family methyltransferase
MDYNIHDCFIDGFSFKFRDISSSNAVEIIVNELINNEYGLFNININKDETFIDVGANIGIVSIYVKKKFGCKIISFEPSPYNIENFKANILLNGFNLSDFDIYEKAVTDIDNDIVNISKIQNNMGGCTILSNNENSNSVETISLSNFITSDVSYIKIDCEGSEYKIIPSIKDKLSNVKYIGIEFHRLNSISETPIDLYNQIRQTFTGKIFMSVWDDDGYEASNSLKNILSNIDLRSNNIDGFYKDSDKDSQWGIISSNKFKINKNQSKRFFCVDDFYEDPYDVRQLALSAEYFEGEGAVGSRTRKQFLFEGLKERFEEIMGKKILDHTEDGMGWFDSGVNGRFQTCKAGTPLVYHCDAQMWAGMIYLTPDAPPQCGTTFFKHRNTGIRHHKQINWNSGQGIEVFNQKTFLDGTPYEQVDKIGNVFNRLVIFDGGLIHSASEYFGWDLESSRLFQMFFFNTEG